MKPRMFRRAISFLYISLVRWAEEILQRSGWDQVWEAIWWFSAYMRLVVLVFQISYQSRMKQEERGRDVLDECGPLGAGVVDCAFAIIVSCDKECGGCVVLLE